MKRTFLPLRPALAALALSLAACGQAQEGDNALSPQAAAGAEQAAAAQISALAARADVKQAFATLEGMEQVNNERLVKLTEIPAPPFREEERAEAYAAMLKAAGLEDVTLDEVGNVIGRRPGTQGGRTIALIAHIDTVFPLSTDVTVRRQGEVFFAPGVGDNTRGLVAMLSLLEAMNAHNIATQADVLFIGSVGEEGLGDLRGVRHLFREGADPIDAVIAVDGGGDDRLVVDAVGSLRYRVRFDGPGGHSYGAFGRAHPHQALARTITGFADAARPITEGAPKATFSVGRIGGGTSINSIPFNSWLEVDMRSVDQGKLTALDTAFKKAVDDALATENALRAIGDEMTVEVEQVGNRPAGQGDRSASLIQHAAAAMRYMGHEPRLSASSTDANIPISLGVPAITLSRGGVSRNAHAPNESWENREAHKALQQLLMIVLAEAGTE